MAELSSSHYPTQREVKELTRFNAAKGGHNADYIDHILAVVVVFAFTLTIFWPRSTPCVAAPAFQVPSGERQLVLDDVGIANIENLQRTLHQPDKKGAVILPNWQSSEGALHIASAPNWDPDANVFKLLVADLAAAPTSYTIRESKDGLHWSRLGKPNINFYCMVYDATDPDRTRRFKAFLPNRGFAVSADALTWTMLDVPPISSNDEYNFSFDQKTHMFIATVKVRGPHGRSHAITTSKDFANWTKPELTFHADDEDQIIGRQRIKARFANPHLHHPLYNIPATYNVDIYNVAVFRYESLYIGLPQMYYQTGKVPAGWPGFDKLPILDEMMVNYRRDGDWAGFHDVQLTCSRDLKIWQRLGDRKPFYYRFAPGCRCLGRVYGVATLVSAGARRRAMVLLRFGKKLRTGVGRTW